MIELHMKQLREVDRPSSLPWIRRSLPSFSRAAFAGRSSQRRTSMLLKQLPAAT